MTSLTVEHWERKAARARGAAEILKGNGAKATMLEMADYYGKLASAGHRNATPPQSNCSPSGRTPHGLSWHLGGAPVALPG
jgi:hypothetical protein